MTVSPKQTALTVIEQLPEDASLDEIADAIWARGTAEQAETQALSHGTSRLLASDPVTLVIANRAARDATLLGLSRQIAFGVVQALPDHATFEDVVVAITTWHWPDDTLD